MDTSTWRSCNRQRRNLPRALALSSRFQMELANKFCRLSFTLRRGKNGFISCWTGVEQNFLHFRCHFLINYYQNSIFTSASSQFHFFRSLSKHSQGQVTENEIQFASESLSLSSIVFPGEEG